MAAPTQFDTGTLIEGFREVPPADLFLTQKFFPGESFFTGRFCQLDVYRGKRLLAPVVSHGVIGRILTGGSTKSRFFDPPWIAPVRSQLTVDLDQRSFGGQVYETRSAQEREAEVVGADGAEMIASIERRIEVMSSELLLTGKVNYLVDERTAPNEYVVENLDYGSPTTFTPATAWTDPTADPLADLETIANQIVADTGFRPDTLVLGQALLTAFMNNPNVQKMFNILHLVVGNMEPEQPVGTAQLVGRLLKPACNVYSYSETYEAEGEPDTQIPMVPPDKGIFGCSAQGGGKLAFGSILQMSDDGSNHEVRDMRYVPLRLAEPGDQRYLFRVASRVVHIPRDLKAWEVILTPTTP
jgi:hypothetical protein